jgi:hypothetical protein
VGRTLPSASSGQALSVAFDFVLEVDFDFDEGRLGETFCSTVEERRFSAA